MQAPESVGNAWPWLAPRNVIGARGPASPRMSAQAMKGVTNNLGKRTAPDPIQRREHRTGHGRAEPVSVDSGESALHGATSNDAARLASAANRLATEIARRPADFWRERRQVTDAPPRRSLSLSLAPGNPPSNGPVRARGVTASPGRPRLQARVRSHPAPPLSSPPPPALPHPSLTRSPRNPQAA